jgi:tetratricopeptide (TPR) repeat protein
LDVERNTPMRMLQLSVLALLFCVTPLCAQEKEFLNIVPLSEPAWVYRARGDNYLRQGRYGDALAQYKKALHRRNQRIGYQELPGIDFERGLARQNGDLELYIHRLQRFHEMYREGPNRLAQSMNQSRYDEARALLQRLQQDSSEIGADRVAKDAEMLDRSLYLRKREEWDFLTKRLIADEYGQSEGSLDVVLQSLNEQLREGENGGDLKLNIKVEESVPYPEVHLSIARLYIRDGLLDLALQELDEAEKGREYFQIPDDVFSVMYTRAEVNRMKANLSEYQDWLRRIIEPETGDSWEGDVHFQTYRDMPLHKISDAAVTILLQDNENRKKYGKAHFEYGALKLQNRNYVTAEPYLKMAFLYAYGYEKQNQYSIVKQMLKEYYISSERRKDAERVDQIDSMIVDALKKSDETTCISF